MEVTNEVYQAELNKYLEMKEVVEMEHKEKLVSTFSFHALGR